MVTSGKDFFEVALTVPASERSLKKKKNKKTQQIHLVHWVVLLQILNYF